MHLFYGATRRHDAFAGQSRLDRASTGNIIIILRQCSAAVVEFAILIRNSYPFLSSLTKKVQQIYAFKMQTICVRRSEEQNKKKRHRPTETTVIRA